MFPFPAESELRDLIHLAKREDLAGDDVTSRLMIPADQVGVGTFLQKETGIACGLPIVEMVCRAYDERLRVEQIPGFHMEIIEGRFSDARTTPLLRVRGPMRSLLSAERVALNFLQHLGGVATQTQRFVRRVAGTAAKIYDTRKTIPGQRALDKYAVRCGGGFNHRIGLYDGSAGQGQPPGPRAGAGAGGVPVPRRRHEPGRGRGPVRGDRGRQPGAAPRGAEGGRRPRRAAGQHGLPEHGAGRGPAGRGRPAGRVDLEASGGVTLETVRQIAATGIDRIAVGALTHSSAGAGRRPGRRGTVTAGVR